LNTDLFQPILIVITSPEISRPAFGRGLDSLCVHSLCAGY